MPILCSWCSYTVTGIGGVPGVATVVGVSAVVSVSAVVDVTSVANVGSVAVLCFCQAPFLHCLLTR